MLDSNKINNIEELNGSKLNVELNKWYKKRSLNANAYCWVLCDKIAKKLTTDSNIITKDDVYRDTIFDIGTFQPMIIEEKALESFTRIWHKQGLGYLVQKVSEKDNCIKIHAYYGSSSYNTQEMSLLIKSLVELAKSLDIETKSQQEIDSLLGAWE